MGTQLPSSLQTFDAWQLSASTPHFPSGKSTHWPTFLHLSPEAQPEPASGVGAEATGAALAGGAASIGASAAASLGGAAASDSAAGGAVAGADGALAGLSGRGAWVPHATQHQSVSAPRPSSLLNGRERLTMARQYSREAARRAANRKIPFAVADRRRACQSPRGLW